MTGPRVIEAPPAEVQPIPRPPSPIPRPLPLPGGEAGRAHAAGRGPHHRPSPALEPSSAPGSGHPPRRVRYTRPLIVRRRVHARGAAGREGRPLMVATEPTR